MDIETGLVRRLVLEEIERIVREARWRGRGFIPAGEHAYAIMNTYPNSGMSGAEIVNQLIGAAASAGVPIEMRQPHAEREVA